MSAEEVLFQAKFVARCGANNINPIDEANKRIDQLAEELKDLENERDKLRFERNALAKWLRECGQEVTIPKYAADVIESEMAGQDPEMIEIRRKVIFNIEKLNKCTLRDLMDRLAITRECQANFIRQVQILTENNVLARSEGNIVTGPNWQNRHQLTV